DAQQIIDDETRAADRFHQTELAVELLLLGFAQLFEKRRLRLAHGESAQAFAHLLGSVPRESPGVAIPGEARFDLPARRLQPLDEVLARDAVGAGTQAPETAHSLPRRQFVFGLRRQLVDDFARQAMAPHQLRRVFAVATL